jgi:hypothetical protein
LIDIDIGRPVAEIKARTGEYYVTEWPKPLVRKSIIIALLLLFREPYTFENVTGRFRRNRNTILFVNY